MLLINVFSFIVFIVLLMLLRSFWSVSWYMTKSKEGHILKILQQTFSLNIPWKNCHVKIFLGKSLYLHCFLKNREAAYFLPPPRWVALVQNICWCLPYQSAKVIKLENNFSKTTKWPCDQHSWSFLSKRNGEMLPLRYGILP